MMRDFRHLFPALEKSVYLNNAAESPMNLWFRERLDNYLNRTSDKPFNKPSIRSPLRKSFSRLFGGAPGDYALVTSTGIGMGMVASGIDWRSGDNVVLPADEHWNITFPWLALRERGVDVRLVPVGEDHRVDPQRIASMVNANTRVLATTAVRFDTGFRADLKVLSAIARRHDALFVVDGIQGAGAVPIDVEEDGIDVLCCAGFKWLLGIHGTGFLYVNSNAQDQIRPVMPGLFAAELKTWEIKYHHDARKYETGSMAYSHFYAWQAGLALVREMGISRIHTRILELTDHLITGLQDKGVTIASPVDRTEERSAIVSFSLGSPQKDMALQEKLQADGVIVAYRQGLIRVSPNFFNTEEEIQYLLDLL